MSKFHWCVKQAKIRYLIIKYCLLTPKPKVNTTQLIFNSIPNMKKIFFILALLIILNPHLIALGSIETCLDSVCHTNEPVIRFPFRIEGKQEDSCGHPGFSVSCTPNGQTLLNLSHWGQLRIQRINYAAQQLWLNDPNNCLPKLLLSLNLSASPFDAVYRQQFSFFNCSFNVEYLVRRYRPINCLSDSPKYVVFATPPSSTVFGHLSSVCQFVAMVEVPVQSPFYDRVMSSELRDDLRLSWDSPACGRCESHGDRCGFKSNNTFDLDCSHIPSKGISRGARYAIAICIGVPALVCSMGVLSCICSWLRIGTHEMVPDFEALPGSRSTTVTGLDRPTIESYPKIVIGENRRLPKKGEKTCSICLSEYMPKETVRTIPECGHCFHAQCIDEWLPLNASCPICRTSPRDLPQPRARSSPSP